MLTLWAIIINLVYLLPRWFRYLILFSITSLIAYLTDAYFIDVTGFLIGGILTLVIYLERR